MWFNYKNYADFAENSHFSPNNHFLEHLVEKIGISNTFSHNLLIKIIKELSR